jgi:hypothetical protein
MGPRWARSPKPQRATTAPARTTIQGMARLYQGFLVPVAASLLTALAYLGWLGWHADQHQVPGTNRIEGPYEPWQVVGLALTLAAIVAVATWLRHGLIPVVTVTAVLTVMWSFDAASQHTDDANIWPVGAFFVLVGSGLGLSLVSVIVTALRGAPTNAVSTG